VAYLDGDFLWVVSQNPNPPHQGDGFRSAQPILRAR
jgi:hypothetical protein